MTRTVTLKPGDGGNNACCSHTQSVLVLEALRICTDLLAPKGTFVTKVFRSGDYSSLLFAFNQLFERVDATKPVASRNESTEIFVVCRGYKVRRLETRTCPACSRPRRDDECVRMMNKEAVRGQLRTTQSEQTKPFQTLQHRTTGASIQCVPAC